MSSNRFASLFRSASCCGIVWLAFGAPADATTLQDAVAKAYSANPTLAEQWFRQRSINEDYVQVRSQYGPTVSLSANAAYDYSRFRGQGTNADQNGVSLGVRQPIYSAGRFRGQLASVRADVQASQQRLRQIEAEVVQAVISVYAAVLRDEQRLGVGRENLIVLRSQLAEAAARRRVQDATVTDEAQAGARLAAAEIQLASLAATLDVSRGQYVQVVGELPVDLQPLPELDGLPATFDQALDLAILNSPDVAAAQYDERSSSANVAARRGERGPSVALTASAGAVGPVTSLDPPNIARNSAAG